MRPRPQRSSRWQQAAALAFIVTAHGIGFWWLLQQAAVREALVATVPMMVDILPPPTLKPPPPPPPPPAPRPAVQPQPAVAPRAEPAPVISAPADAPGPAVTAALPPVVLPPIGPAPAPVLTATPPPAPPPIVPPGFSAAYLDNPPPVYPRASQRAQETGRVLLHVHVGADGHPDQVDVQQSSGHPRLDQAALQAVRRWKFTPARQGDKPVAAWVIVPIDCHLED